LSKEELEDVMQSRNDITHRSLEPEDRDRPLSIATRFKRDWNIADRDMPVSLESLSLLTAIDVCESNKHFVDRRCFKAFEKDTKDLESFPKKLLKR